ncbi:hypothetical protein BDL97_09G086500 [Sphagnum fallax]|nr:hypothetical protein BDL97_09G086500 [Sphagnum fallax]
MVEMVEAMKGPRRYSGAEFDSWCDMQMLRNARLFSPFLAWKGLFQHLEGPPMDDCHEFRRDHVTEIEEWSTSTQVVPPPLFNPITEFFLRLKKNYQGVKTKKLRNLQEFERKINESLRKAYTRMRWLIAVTQWVIEVQAIQFWYGILDKELRRRARDLNMVEEKVVTFGFNRDIITTSHGQQSTSQPRTGGGGSHGGHVRFQLGSGGTGAQRPLPSFASQQQGPSCWTCGGVHIRRDCTQESVQCDNYGRVGHPRERCFDLYPELRSSRGGGRGGAAQRGRGGRGGRGGGGGRGTPMVRAPPLIIPPPTIEATMATRIEQLEQRLATMAPTSYGGDDLFYMTSVAQIEASVVVTRGVIRTSEPRGATVELDPHRGEAVDTDISSSVVLQMVTSVLGSSTFSANDLMALGVALTRVFRLAATLCEHGSVVATSVEQPVVSGVDSPWQAAPTKMDALPARPAIDCERLTHGVCMLDNRSGIFRLVSPTGQVYKPDRVLLDSACIGLGIRRSELELCPFQIQTSLGGATDRSNFITHDKLSVQMKPDHVTDSSRLGVTTIVTAAELYDMDYWIETATYRPMPVRFISGVRPGGSPLEVLASIAGFSGMVTWPGDLLEGNISTVDTPVYEDIEEVSSFVATVSSSLDVPLWRSSGAWREAFVHVEEEEVPQRTPISSPVGLFPLDTTPIAWEYPSEGICVLDLFGGISTGLATVLQVDETARRVSSHHLALLMRRYPELLSSCGEGLRDPRSCMFWEMLRVLCHLQTHQARVPTYILENVPLLGDTRSHVMANVHQIRVGSRAHLPRLWWTNLLPKEVVKVVDRSPMAVVNRVGQPKMALPTFGGPGLVWDTCLQQLVEPNADERERAMGFPTGMTFVPSIYEASRQQVLGQAMDLNCLTWIVSLGMAEQRRLKATFVIVTPLVSSLPTGTVEASTGGEESYTFHPWSTWDVLGEHVKVVAHAVGGETWEPLIGPKLIGGERRQLMQFLRAYRSCFAFSMKELGALIRPDMRIELASNTPIFRRPYKYSDMERDLIRSQMLDLLEAGLVELSHGEYASAIVMPAKKDVHGNYTDRRMCGDYRPINRQTKSDKYAMPTPEEIFDVGEGIVQCPYTTVTPLAYYGLGYRWSLDFAGPLPLTVRHNKYVLVMVEHFSKWIELVPSPDKSSEGVAYAFLDRVLSHFGAPTEVLTDQGTEFQGEFQVLCDKALIDHRTTFRDHPEANGLVERVVQTMKRALRKYGLEKAT